MEQRDAANKNEERQDINLLPGQAIIRTLFLHRNQLGLLHGECGALVLSAAQVLL